MTEVTQSTALQFQCDEVIPHGLERGGPAKSPRIGGDFGRQAGVVEHRGIRERRKRSNGCDGSIEKIKHMMKVFPLVGM
jgi:hypothetical protein